MMSFFGLSFLLLIPILAAQWIGVVAIGRVGRAGAWWCMLIGVILTTFGMLMIPLLNLGIMSVGGSGTFDFAFLLFRTGLFSTFGTLLFMTGFAVHAMGHRRVCERVRELEMVIEAQNEQMERGA